MNTQKIPNGALTALVTPFMPNMYVNWTGFHRLIDFQISQGISGIVPCGTTGESPTLTRPEHEMAIDEALKPRRIFAMPGCGSNSTAEAMVYVQTVSDNGGRAVLLVDPYYNGPSSLEIMREYYGPIAKEFPAVAIIPYIIPGRAGCALLPEDLVALSQEFPNICAVKEATGDLKRMARTRKLASADFKIFSGDDGLTFEMMSSLDIKANGVI